MRVKVGDEWFEAEPGRPIMVELTEDEKETIGSLPASRDRLAMFAKNDLGERPDPEQSLAWMNEGATRQAADLHPLAVKTRWQLVVETEKSEDTERSD